jgi:hypothetical protein
MKTFLVACGLAFASWQCGAEGSEGTVQDWSGEYWYGDYVNMRAKIELFPNGKFETYADSCWQDWVAVKGTWVDTGQEISFLQTSTEGKFVIGLTSALKVVRKDGVLLVPFELANKFKRKGPDGYTCFRKDRAYGGIFGVPVIPE